LLLVIADDNELGKDKMQIIHKDIRHGEIKAKTENLDDLWYLSNIVEPSDLVTAKTERKIKLGSESDRNQKVARKTVILTIEVEKVEFASSTSVLRLSGLITAGPEDVPRGQYHTISVDDNTVLKIVKKQWYSYQLKKLDEAQKPLKAKILVAVFDREEAHFALLNRQGYKHLSSISGNVQKKDVDEVVKGSFWLEIIAQLKEYDTRHGLQSIILASPAFWKDELQKELKNEEIKKKCISATCSSADRSAINEVLKRPETQSALQQDRLHQELLLVEKLLTEISKNGLAAYGLDEVTGAAQAGAVEHLMVTNNIIQELREKGTFEQLDNIMKQTEQARGTINILSSDNDAGKKLAGLGGVAALLRYKMSY